MNDFNDFKILSSEDIQNLRSIREISSGASGRVLEVGREEKLALKIMHIGEISTKKFKGFISEYEKLCMLNHPNIVQAFGIFLSDEKNPPSILLELCLKDLNTAIKKSTPSQVEIITWVYQIAEAMKYVHDNSLIHRDLKPTNILFGKDGIIRISDFGISKLMTSEEQSTTLGSGTQKFMAPEILKEEKYNEKVDVYSFGVVVYFMLSGGEMPKINIIQVGNGKKAKIPDSFTSFAKDLISNCWNYNPKDRPSFEEILSLLDTNDYELFELKTSELKNVRTFVKNHKKLILSSQNSKSSDTKSDTPNDKERPKNSPLFQKAVSQFSQNKQFALLCSLIIENGFKLLTNPQTQLLYDNFNCDSDLVTLLDSMCELSENYSRKIGQSGFNAFTIQSIYEQIKPESIVEAVKWSREQKGGTFSMADKFIHLLHENGFIENRKCKFVHVINARKESVPELVYKTKADNKRVHVYRRPGCLGLQCPGNVIVLSMLPNNESDEISYGMIIHNCKSSDNNLGVVSYDFYYNKFYFPLFEAYMIDNFQPSNFIEIYQTHEINKRYSIFVYIDCNRHKSNLSFCPRNKKAKDSMIDSIKLLNSLNQFLPRSIISNVGDPKCVVEVTGYGTSDQYTTSVYLSNDLPLAFPLNKESLKFAACNIDEMKKNVPSIRFAVTSESLIYKEANDDDFEYELAFPDASPSIQSVFDINHPSHLVLLVNKDYKNVIDTNPLSWGDVQSKNLNPAQFKWNLDKFDNPEILAKDLNEDTTCLFICDPPPTFLPQPIYAYLEDGSVKVLSVCKHCLIESIRSIDSVANSIDSKSKKFDYKKLKNLSIMESLPGIQLLDGTSDDNDSTWPQVPLGQSVWAALSEINELGYLVKAWLTLVVKLSADKNIKFTQCPNHPGIYYDKTNSKIRLKCQKCDMFFCSSCSHWHKLSEKCPHEMDGIKRCPNCGLPTFKIDGSNEISCFCGKHWCYKCDKSPIFNIPVECYRHLSEIHGGYFT